jgi:chemotaxis response regulator CheB
VRFSDDTGLNRLWQCRELLPEVLRRDAELDVTTVEDKMPILYGRIYVARPDLHLLVEREHIRVVFGAKVNRHRRSIHCFDLRPGPMGRTSWEYC